MSSSQAVSLPMATGFGRRAAGIAAATWGLVGISAILGRSISRLIPPAVEAFRGPRLGLVHWLIAAGSILFLGYFEGFKAFQRGFSPRVVVRAMHLARAPQPLHAILAPLFCIGLIGATRRRLITSWSVVTGVFAIVMIVRQLGQPYRGLIDAGVVLGLGWGFAAILVFTVRALSGKPPQASPDLP